MNHDLTANDNLIKKQSDHVNTIKFRTRVDNEIYLREHPEIEFLLDGFLVQLLEDRPDNTMTYAGKYFNTNDLRELWEQKNKMKNN